VSYNDIVEQYLPWLSKLTGYTYRLPTEAEWSWLGGNKFGGRSGPAAEAEFLHLGILRCGGQDKKAIWAGVIQRWLYTAVVGPNSLRSLRYSQCLGVGSIAGMRPGDLAREEVASLQVSCAARRLVASEFRFLPDGVWSG
jgi:hypothetical protein